jgi:hypothetical protein
MSTEGRELAEECETQEEFDEIMAFMKEEIRDKLYCESSQRFFDRVNNKFTTLYTAEHETLCYLDGDEQPEISKFDIFWLKVLSRLLTFKEIGLLNRYEKFIKLSQRNGFNVNQNMGTIEEHNRIKDAIRNSTVDVTEELAKAIITARDLTEEEYKELKSKSDYETTYDDYLAKQKHFVMRYIPTGYTLTIPNIILVLKGSEVRREMYYLNLTHSELMSKDKGDRHEAFGIKTVEDRSHYARQQNMIKKCLEEINIKGIKNFHDLFNLNSDADISLTEENIDAFKLFYNNNYKNIKTSFPSKLTKKAKFGDIWKVILGDKGFPVQGTRRKVNNKLVTQYKLDLKAYQMFRDNIKEQLETKANSEPKQKEARHYSVEETKNMSGKNIKAMDLLKLVKR